MRETALDIGAIQYDNNHDLNSRNNNTQKQGHTDYGYNSGYGVK
jgi:hypothetical protein